MEIYAHKTRPTRAWLECTTCRIETIHSLVYAVAVGGFGSIDELDILDLDKEKVNAWLIWVCKGCNSLVLEDTQVPPRWFEDESVDLSHPSFSLRYPKMNYVSPRHFTQIPEKLDRLYQETITAFNNELWVLSATGLRSLLEGICDDKEKSKKHDRLEDKIKSLAKLGIPANMIENLHSFRFMGNKAVHELTAPDEEDLELAIEIIGDIMNYFYSLDYKLTMFSQRQKHSPKYVVAEDDSDSDESD